MKENRMQDSALLIIDLQTPIKRLVKKAPPYGWDKIIENNKKLIHYFSAQNLPIYLIAVEPKFLSKFTKNIFTRLLLQEDLENNPRLHKFIKFGPSAFSQSENNLEKELKEQGVKTIFVSGVSMSNGVLKTAQDGAKIGFESFVIEDASGDRNKRNFQNAIHNTIPKFSKVVTLAQVKNM